MQGWDDKKDEETEEFYKMKKCDADPAWVAYLVARKQIDMSIINFIIQTRVNHTAAMYYIEESPGSREKVPGNTWKT